MSIRQLLAAAGTVIALCAGCVDPDFNLGNIEVEGVVFKNMEVPIGNFEEITLQTILDAQGASMIPLQPGVYSLSGSAKITGLNFKFDESLYFKEAELHTVILNTIPLDMNVSVDALDAEGNPCQDVKVSIEAEKTPMIASGKKGQPSSNPVVLRVECKDRYITLEAIRLNFSGKTGAGFEGETPSGDEGLTLTQVELKMPEGFTMKL